MTKWMTNRMNADPMNATLRITKALADLQRLRILMLLRVGELCVCQIIEVLRLAPSTVSKHLSILSGAGLLESRKEGRWAYYRRTPRRGRNTSGDAVLKWLDRTLADAATVTEDHRALRSALRCAPEALAERQRRH